MNSQPKSTQASRVIKPSESIPQRQLNPSLQSQLNETKKLLRLKETELLTKKIESLLPYVLVTAVAVLIGFTNYFIEEKKAAKISPILVKEACLGAEVQVAVH